MSHGYRCSSAPEVPPRSPHFIPVVHTTGGVIHGYMHLASTPVFELLFEIHIRPCVTVDAQGNGWFATDSQVYKRMSGVDRRTGISYRR